MKTPDVIKNPDLRMLLPLAGAFAIGYLAVRRFFGAADPTIERYAGGAGAAPVTGESDGERYREKNFRGGTQDAVDEAAIESFPASDPPAW